MTAFRTTRKKLEIASGVWKSMWKRSVCRYVHATQRAFFDSTARRAAELNSLAAVATSPARQAAIARTYSACARIAGSRRSPEKGRAISIALDRFPVKANASASLRRRRALSLRSSSPSDAANSVRRRNSPRLKRPSAYSELVLMSLPVYSMTTTKRALSQARLLGALLSLERKCYNTMLMRVSQNLLMKRRDDLLKSVPV